MLAARGTSVSGSDDLLYECLYISDSNCILTPDLLEIIKKHSGGGGSGSAGTHYPSLRAMPVKSPSYCFHLVMQTLLYAKIKAILAASTVGTTRFSLPCCSWVA